MEHRFEYRHLTTERDLDDYLNYTRFKSPAAIGIMAVIALFALASAALLAAILITGWGGARGVAAGVVLVAVFLIVLPASFFFSGASAGKRLKEAFRGRSGETTAYFTDSVMHFDPGEGDPIDEEFSHVKEVIETERLILVKTWMRSTFFFAKEGFTVGTPEELKAFLASKGIRVSG